MEGNHPLPRDDFPTETTKASKVGTNFSLSDTNGTIRDAAPREIARFSVIATWYIEVCSLSMRLATGYDTLAARRVRQMRAPHRSNINWRRLLMLLISGVISSCCI